MVKNETSFQRHQQTDRDHHCKVKNVGHGTPSGRLLDADIDIPRSYHCSYRSIMHDVDTAVKQSEFFTSRVDTLPETMTTRSSSAQKKRFDVYPHHGMDVVSSHRLIGLSLFLVFSC